MHDVPVSQYKKLIIQRNKTYSSLLAAWSTSYTYYTRKLVSVDYIYIYDV